MRIGWGCVELPASYQAYSWSEDFPDHQHGTIVAQDLPDIDWSFGFGEAQPLCYKEKCTIVEKYKEDLGGRMRTVGMLDEAGAKAWFVADELISFT